MEDLRFLSDLAQRVHLIYSGVTKKSCVLKCWVMSKVQIPKFKIQTTKGRQRTVQRKAKEKTNLMTNQKPRRKEWEHRGHTRTKNKQRNTGDTEK